MYMEKLLRDDGQTWSVDCEYNRHGIDTKRVPSLKDLPRRGGKRTGAATPDIVVHRRGREGPNLIAIEVKRLEDDPGDDKMKLRGYKQPPLNYEHAFHLRVSSDRSQCRLLSIEELDAMGAAAPRRSPSLLARSRRLAGARQRRGAD